MARLVGLYNADGSLLGELRYLRTKLIERDSCSLCDLTHGWNPLGKRSWKRACEEFEVEIELLHKDEALPEQLSVVETLPAILHLKEDLAGGTSWVVGMTSEEIANYRGAPRRLLEVLKGRCQ